MNNSWGPWSPGCKGGDQRALMLRCLGTIAFMLRQQELSALLRKAETDAMSFVEAEQAIEKMPALTRRKLIATFSAITWPRKDRA